MTEEKNITPGIYAGIPNDAYHGGPGISKSGLDLIRRSPLHYRHVTTAANDNERQPTAAQMLGTAFHMLLLEPAEFAQQYCLGLQRSDVPEAIDDREVLAGMIADLNAKRLPKLPTSGSKDELVTRIREAAGTATVEVPVEGKGMVEVAELKGADLKAVIASMNETRPGLLPTSGSRHALADLLRANGVDVTLWSDVQAEWLENNGHRTVLTREEWEQLHAMRDAVETHPVASRLLDYGQGKAELSVYWRDPVTGVLCRCRPDWWLQQRGIIVDVKTCEDASPEGFAKALANWRYHAQDAFYLDGCELAITQASLAIPAPQHFLFLAVEKRPPYAVAVYAMDQESRQLGRIEYREDLDVYSECLSSGNWPGYGDRIQSLGLPAWYLIRAERAERKA